jgi:hypothetical protein
MSADQCFISRGGRGKCSGDGVLIPCKVAGLGRETVHAVLESRFATGSSGPHELAEAKSQFARLTTENARRLLRFRQVPIFVTAAGRGQAFPGCGGSKADTEDSGSARLNRRFAFGCPRRSLGRSYRRWLIVARDLHCPLGAM